MNFAPLTSLNAYGKACTCYALNQTALNAICKANGLTLTPLTTRRGKPLRMIIRNVLQALILMPALAAARHALAASINPLRQVPAKIVQQENTPS